MDRKTQAAGSEPADPPLFGDRNPLLGYLRLALAFAAAAAILALADSTPLLLALGLLFIIPGEWLHTWAHGHLIKTRELITSGPYAYTQNPLYLGRLLLVTGFLIAARLPGWANLACLALAWALFFGYYMRRKTRVEGRRLRAFHGAVWEDYHRSVPVLFPSLRRYPRSENRRFSWRIMAYHREYITHLLLLAGLAVLAWKAAH